MGEAVDSILFGVDRMDGDDSVVGGGSDLLPGTPLWRRRLRSWSLRRRTISRISTAAATLRVGDSNFTTTVTLSVVSDGFASSYPRCYCGGGQRCC